MLCYGGEKRKRSECLAPSKREDGHLRTMGVVTIATKSTTTGTCQRQWDTLRD